MELGDTRYTFKDNDGVEHTEVIPAKVIRSGRHKGWSINKAMRMYLFENGFNIDKPEEIEKSSDEKRKSRKVTRTPNKVKLELINTLSSALGEIGDIEIVNPERQVRIKIDDNIYEFTLVQKRK